MQAGFSSTIAGWQAFYMLAGTASATLVGLLFVAVSINVDLLGESGADAILSLARETFIRFIFVVVVALVFLVPRQTSRGLGLPLLAVGVADALTTVWVGRVVITELKRNESLRNAVNQFVLPVVMPLVSSVGLILIALTVLSGTTSYLGWMVVVVALILGNAATNAWDLMLGLARYRGRRDDRLTAGDIAPSGKEGEDERSARMS